MLKKLLCNTYKDAKEHLVNSLKTYKDLTNELEIDHFKDHIYKFCFTNYLLNLMNNLDIIVNEFTNSKIDIVNYISFLFDNKLYIQSLNRNFTNIYYSILWCEYVKYKLYLDISKGLVEDHETLQVCNKNMEICLTVIDTFYNLAKKNSTTSKEELECCQKLVDFLNKKKKYEIEIIIES